MSKPLTTEMLRILHAIDDDRLSLSSSGRWIIDGEDRPERRARELLNKRGLVEWAPGGRYRITDKGRTALERVNA